MVNVIIRTEDKAFKKFKIPGFKVKPWERKHPPMAFKAAEELLHTIYEEMDRAGVKKGTVQITLYFEEKEIACSPITLTTDNGYPLLVDLIRQDMVQSMSETTTREEEDLMRRLLEAIQSEVGATETNQREEQGPPTTAESVGTVAEPVQEAVEEEGLEEELTHSTEELESTDISQETVEDDLLIEEDMGVSESTPRAHKKRTTPQVTASYVEYVMPELSQELIDETLKTCSKEELYSYLNVHPEQINDDTLEAYQKAFVEKRLKELDFDQLRVAFKALVEDIRSDLAKELGAQFKTLAQDKPNRYADEHIDEQFSEIKTAYTQKYFDYEETQQEALASYVTAQEEAKQKELEAFEKELEQKYSERMTNERLKVDAAIQRKKEQLALSLEDERSVVYQALLTEKVQEKEQALVDFKQQTEERAKAEVEAAALNVVSQYSEMKELIAKEVEEKSIEWQQLLTEKEALALQKEEAKKKEWAEKEEKRMRQEELDLQKEAQSLKKKELETPQQPQMNIVPVSVPQQASDSYTEQLLRELLEEKKQDQTKKDSIVRNSLLALVCVSILGTGAFMVQQSNTTKTVLAQTQQELVEMKQQASVTQTAEMDETLDTLIEKRDFSTAFEKYTDAKSLAKMEDYFAATEDLPMLKKFNKEFKTATGNLNEAILEGDNKKIVAAYEGIKDKSNVSEKQKQAVKLAYYGLNKKELAEKV
ncbi:hypothetical protein R4Y59_002588 [Enterococcus faecalis]|nr:hypothetical protein [Enterococcus faecalis]